MENKGQGKITKVARRKRGMNDLSLVKNLALLQNDNGEVVLSKVEKKEEEKDQRGQAGHIIIDENTPEEPPKKPSKIVPHVRFEAQEK